MDLSDYIDAVCACDEIAALKRLLIRAFDDIGAKAITGYGFPYGCATSTKRDPIISTFPPEVREIYRSRAAGQDPIMYAAMTLGAPVHFLKIESSLHLNDPTSAALEAMRAAGLRDGVTTPVFAKPGAFAYFVCAFGEPRPDLTSADLRRIMITFSEFYFRYRELTRVRHNTLSQREREVLVAIVADKSNAEIADTLGVSEHTVETYVRRCFVKLDVTNRTQAVLRYLGAGAIEPSN